MYEQIPETGAPGHDAAGHDPAFDRHEDHGLDHHDIPGYAEIEAFFKRDFIGDLPSTKHHLLDQINGAAGELEVWYGAFEEKAQTDLETRRAELQSRLVAAREAIEAKLVEYESGVKDGIADSRDALIADVVEKRAAVEEAIGQLQNTGNYGKEDEKELLEEIHEAKEAFSAAVTDARSDFDLILQQARDASESRLTAARSMFETEATRKRGDLDIMINTLRNNLSEVAANKKEALGLVLGAAWEDLEEAIAEKVDAFNWAVEQKVAYINNIEYYGLRAKLLDQVKELQITFEGDINYVRNEMADAAEARRLEADAAISADQEEFEVFAAGILDTCDSNRAI